METCVIGLAYPYAHGADPYKTVAANAIVFRRSPPGKSSPSVERPGTGGAGQSQIDKSDGCC